MQRSQNKDNNNTNKLNAQEQKQQDLLNAKQYYEGEEFSVICEQIEDEPSIHVGSLDQFQCILKRPQMIESKLQVNAPMNTQMSQYDPTQLDILQHDEPCYETFQTKNNERIEQIIVQNQQMLQNQSKILLQSLIQDETYLENSTFFDENNCSTSLLHRCHLIENYCIPNKPIKSTKYLYPKQIQCNEKLHHLIQQVKKDVVNSSSILLNQSKSNIFQIQQLNNTSNTLMKSNQTDITIESQFPNITNEELHISLSRYNIVQGGGVSGLHDENYNNMSIENNSVQHYSNISATNNNNSSVQQNSQLAQKAQAANDLHKLHLLQTLQSLQYVKQIEPPSEEEILKKQVILPKSQHQKLIIFDMDETLMHCVDDIETENPDIILKIKFPNGELIDAGINIRPYAVECLREASKKYQVAIFTASHKFYADVVLDYLDPKGEYISYRMYRDQCFQTEEGVYIKDLRIIKNKELKDMVIVDNAVYSFGFQINNGIPIIPFYSSKEDEELLHMINYINTLVYFNDMREQNAKAFQLKILEATDVTDYIEVLFGNVQNQNSSNNDDQNQTASSSSKIYCPSQTAIQEVEGESEQSFGALVQNQNERMQNSQKQSSTDDFSLNNNDNIHNRSHEQSSELDQEEIMKLKKRLDFIEISSCTYNSKTTNTIQSNSSSYLDQKSTPKIGGGTKNVIKSKDKGQELLIQKMVKKEQMKESKKNQKSNKEEQSSIRGNGERDIELFHKMLISSSSSDHPTHPNHCQQ